MPYSPRRLVGSPKKLLPPIPRIGIRNPCRYGDEKDVAELVFFLHCPRTRVLDVL